MTRAEMIQLIKDESKKRGLDPFYTLTMARLETGIRNVVGDKSLHKNPRYMDAVRRQHPDNVYTSMPSLWASYGPFQLHARWRLGPWESPAMLNIPEVSIPRSVALLSEMLSEEGGNWERVRLRWVCGKGKCSPKKRRKVLRRWRYAVRPRSSSKEKKETKTVPPTTKLPQSPVVPSSEYLLIVGLKLARFWNEQAAILPPDGQRFFVWWKKKYPELKSGTWFTGDTDVILELASREAHSWWMRNGMKGPPPPVFRAGHLAKAVGEKISKGVSVGAWIAIAGLGLAIVSRLAK